LNYPDWKTDSEKDLFAGFAVGWNSGLVVDLFAHWAAHFAANFAMAAY